MGYRPRLLLASTYAASVIASAVERRVTRSPRDVGGVRPRYEKYAPELPKWMLGR